MTSLHGSIGGAPPFSHLLTAPVRVPLNYRGRLPVMNQRSPGPRRPLTSAYWARSASVMKGSSGGRLGLNTAL